MRMSRARAFWVAWGLSWAACADDAGDSPSGAAGSAAGAGAKPASGMVGAAGASSAGPADLAAFAATGLNKYLGAAKPASTEMSGAETHYRFAEADGPVCLRGEPFSMSTRAGTAQDLVIYLQGGGSCTTALCRATESANPQIPARGVLDAADAANPVASWNLVYVPYCDGSLHFGDSDIADQNRKHHGLRNASAALDVALAAFPEPPRVLLMGSSAGGYGTIWLTSLVRLAYPRAQLYVFNDAGIAVANPANATGFRGVLGEWGATQFLPADCEACQTSPHLTQWMAWNLQKDPGLTQAMFSAYEDSVIAGTFLMLDPAVFKQALLDETAKVVDSAPARAKRFLIAGTQHTVTDIHATAIGGVSVAQWLEQMLTGDEAWDNQLSP
jgi:hypothetical protein